MGGEGIGLDTALAQRLDAAAALPREALLAALATIRAERPLAGRHQSPRDRAEAWAWIERLRAPTARAELSGDVSGVEVLLR